jgi:hypothetical protein
MHSWSDTSMNRSCDLQPRVRAGLVPHVRSEFARKLKPLQVKQCPFVDLPTEGSSRWGGGVSAEDMKEMIWTEPETEACFSVLASALQSSRYCAFGGNM